MGHESFVQEAFVGYKYGTFSKLGIICERNPSGGEEAMDVDEESKVEPDAPASNMNEFNL